MNKNTRIKEKKQKKYFDKKRVLLNSKQKQMEIAYNNNETKKPYKEVISIRKGIKPQTLLIKR
jgi:hypothetical protein